MSLAASNASTPIAAQAYRTNVSNSLLDIVFAKEIFTHIDRQLGYGEDVEATEHLASLANATRVKDERVLHMCLYTKLRLTAVKAELSVCPNSFPSDHLINEDSRC